MITLYVSLGCLVGGILMGYSWRAREEATLKAIVKEALVEWSSAKSAVMGIGSSMGKVAGKL